MTSSRSKVLSIAVVVLRVVLAGVFVYAGYLKIREPWQQFAGEILKYEILPPNMTLLEIIARGLPWLEVALGVALLVGWKFLRPASVATALLLLFFNAMLWHAFLTGKDIDCGCFGAGDKLTWKSLVRDGSMFAGALLVLWWAFRRPRPEPLNAALAADAGLQAQG